MYQQPELLIAGAPRQTAEFAENIVVNPATGVELARLPIASQADIDAAVAAADKAFLPWSETAPARRSRILRDAAILMRERLDDMAHALTLENGKTLAEAKGEIGFTADVFDWFADEARRAYGRVIPSAVGTRMIALKEPVGPIAAMSPWNFPAVTAAKKVAAALAAGCTVVLKPAEETPATPLAMARCLIDAGLPAGAINVIFGRPAEISERLMASPEIAKVSFTGSTNVGRELARLAAPGLKRLTMELGGHAPVIVMDDVDLETALDLSVAGKFRNAGQVCTSATRFFVHHRVYDAFVSGFADRAMKIKVGDGLDPSSQMGPLSNRRRPPALERLVEDAVSCGAKVAAGGKRIESQGFFFEPTVLADVPPNARVMQEEPFGPLAAIVPFRELDDAISAANDIPFGLAAYALTESSRTARRIVRGLKTGVVGINTFAASAAETPFGGVKDSGYGVEGGSEGLDSYLVTKFVHEN
ncbi:Succinate-semialdehyde dehydrogenase (NAD(P)+) [Nitratireductor indicus C115]|uniref:Succinate-semialdehyde dehydrogenase (NAD(P)+) n=1 Tax=Nitratireductor indicus C115 TaxID=1231190 RepID=K2NQA1_9HYPH|nr:NAD-dependent succinate-semialdehyde dehydrogenase [Nitratireductor indicus]EKF41535.1 Succinate-semialdehyde dehydrogenase (NAD(P)+) [Nitratireductor indicus C115]SFQ69830.1 succinate-semialdehyde dehydrogenase / glutarate-semialdehyde dehydrogenase [Nitratireductor indicus]